ncbi:MAG: FKBP-type peptidyl-prolyl cis-trans isomerase [Prevotella sp.]|nr:FKBP-type peptidyl-prolyl cis-trans isomerase [Prevotella sp.]
MKIKFFLLAGLSALLLTACSEESDTVEEYADWQNKNEQYFESAYQLHAYDLALMKYSLSDASTAEHTDYILVNVIHEGDYDAKTPYLTDTVQVHYVGHLIPSATYTTGYQFDASYQEPFDYDTARPTKLAVNGLIPGFTTALLKMHRGDHWMITIPYQLGYGTSTSSSGAVPAYSTLLFEIRLEDFWSKKQGDRE